MQRELNDWLGFERHRRSNPLYLKVARVTTFLGWQARPRRWVLKQVVGLHGSDQPPLRSEQVTCLGYYNPGGSTRED